VGNIPASYLHLDVFVDCLTSSSDFLHVSLRFNPAYSDRTLSSTEGVGLLTSTVPSNMIVVPYKLMSDTTLTFTPPSSAIWTTSPMSQGCHRSVIRAPSS
jgi:hypothetical protein